MLHAAHLRRDNPSTTRAVAVCFEDVMTPTVVVTPHALLKLQTLDPEEARRVVETVGRIAQDPASPAMRRLAGLPDTFVCRVGGLQVVLKVEGSKVAIVTLYTQQLVRQYMA
jgi:mRNA-degrading endonuclease RelE of RelBE toxin-antitoxin system